MNKLAKLPKESLESKMLFLIENNKLIEKEITKKGKRCDMHCHDKYNLDTNNSTLYIGSPLTKGTGLGIGVRESYAEPEEIYQIAKARGMDFVTISSHNSITGAIELIAKYEDAFVSCEYDVNGSEAGHVIHVLVSGHEYSNRNISYVHKKLLRAANKGHEYFSKTCEDYGLFYGLAHPAWISSPKLDMKPEYLHSWLNTFNNWEINGDIQLENKLAKRALEIFLEDGKKKSLYAGSDCHCLNHVGLTFTETLDDKIETPKEFLEALKKGEVGVGSYKDGDFAEKFHGSVKMLLDDTFTGVRHYISRESHNRKKLIIYGSTILLPVGLAIGLAIITVPYVMAFLEKKTTEHRTKKLAEDYFSYLEFLETKPLEEKIESLIEEHKEVSQRYIDAKNAIKERSLILNPVGWAKFVINLFGNFKIFKTDYNFKLEKDNDVKKLEP